MDNYKNITSQKIPNQNPLDVNSVLFELNGKLLSLGQVVLVAENGAKVDVSSKAISSKTFIGSRKTLLSSLEKGKAIYGVNTLFGGLANQVVPETDLSSIQHHLIESHLSGAGDELALEDIRGAMLIRANTLLKGVSAVRPLLVQRYVDLLNFDAIPRVLSLGSIGASGDLIPLSAIAGAAIGLNDQFKLHYQGEICAAPKVLEILGLPRIELAPKEGLALINGTAVHTAVSVRNLAMCSKLFNLNLQVQTLIAQAMRVDIRAYDDFVHQQRPHPGQLWVARQLRKLLKGSKLVRSPECVQEDFSEQEQLVQDRYSIRCMPQFLAPIVEGLGLAARQLSVELNSATDNPLVDYETDTIFHAGNFLGQHQAIAMDQIRVFIALLAKHSDAQIALLVEPRFSMGLTPSLMNPSAEGRSLGLKPLQILSNSVVPLIEANSSSLAVRFPVYAEQYNQNINSQAMGSAVLTRKSLELWQTQIAVSLLFSVQAALLRCAQLNVNWRTSLSKSGVELIDSVLSILDIEDIDGSTLLFDKMLAGHSQVWVDKIELAIEKNQLIAMHQGLDLNKPNLVE